MAYDVETLYAYRDDLSSPNTLNIARRASRTVNFSTMMGVLVVCATHDEYASI